MNFESLSEWNQITDIQYHNMFYCADIDSNFMTWNNGCLKELFLSVRERIDVIRQPFTTTISIKSLTTLHI